uniref:Apple domain-containing protein n=1 Tax=Poecilia reticulata TaxID=8081 RepID=A0A3P9PXL9_POERE
MVLSENRNRYAVKSVTECAAKCDSEMSFTCKRSFRHIFSRLCVEYLLECVNEKGADYRGTVNRTKSGKLSESISSFFPRVRPISTKKNGG